MDDENNSINGKKINSLNKVRVLIFHKFIIILINKNTF